MVDWVNHMFVTSPNVVKKVIYQDIDEEALGSSLMHDTISGVCAISESRTKSSALGR